MEKDAPFNRRSRPTPDSIGSEITEQSTQSNLQESQGRLAAIVEKSPDFIGIAGLDMTVLYLNGAGQRLVGLNGMGEVRATKRTDYFFPEDRKFVEQIITPAVLRNGSWSGEIRFRHFKTAVILTPGDSLQAPLAELQRPITTAGAKTLERAEREYIMKVLDEAKWVIGGPNGAAARLGLKRTTLLYKLAKLGISRGKI